ncbi:ABC transporter substrate binding protein [Variovorax sp.]|jgi:putative tryptophan/tyrosine transport system substrate-binding protein|uniref:ABC transporter substrate binding protein n=2 Tax=Variovorax sp. TaxID=1871043 RepID=UPI0012092882|nr:ABC transporter substrate binding protein [Variovorax sp.]TAJ58061.1 MAG: ABC transporter substrate-binding protein [Variovorax sp.]
MSVAAKTSPPIHCTTRLLRGAARAWLACAALLGAALCPAAGFTVLMGDDLAAHAEFVQQLRQGLDPASRFELVRLAPGSSGVPDNAAAEPGDVNVGVRTRSMRSSISSAEGGSLTMAVGAVAARAAIERPGQEPLVLAMLSRLDYEGLRTSPALRRTDRRVGVLLRDPAMADQLALVGAVLPAQRHRIGVVATPESEPLVRDLQRAAQVQPGGGWDLQVEYAPDARSLATALRAVVPRSDALMVLPDLIGDNQAATLSVLRAGAGAGLPVFGASEGLVRSGGLAAAVSTPAQLAQQARLLAQKVASSGSAGGGGNPLVEAATPATVRINPTVARGLGLRLPEERELTERLTVTR